MTYSYGMPLNPWERTGIVEALRGPEMEHQGRNRKEDRHNSAHPRFIFSRVIGEGGLGVVKKVYDTKRGKKVALKTARKNMPLLDKACEILLKEARVTASLNHPNIIPAYDFGVNADLTPYFTMKLVEGKTLRQILSATRIDERREEDTEKLLRIFVKVLEGIAFAHSRGVVHGDIKPDNVMVGDDGRVYVIDWGNAVLKDRSYGPKTESGSPVGTPGYMSPEQAEGNIEALDERTDIFCLGGILYEILTGASPHQPHLNNWSLEDMINGLVDPPYERTQDQLPPELCHIAMRAMRKAKIDRYQSAIDLKSEVEGYLVPLPKAA